MSVVSKLKSGFIYESSFDEIDSNWEISDMSRINIDGGLHILSGDTPVSMYFSQLTSEKQFVLDVKNVYNPQGEGETGGIIVYSDENNFIALEEYFDAEKGVTNTYPWIRLIRDYNVYSGYWSDNGKHWTLVGTHDFGELSPKIGLFLGGSTENMLVEYVRIFRSPYITVINPPPRSMLQLVGIDGVLKQVLCLVHYPKVAFHVSPFGVPLEAKFRWHVDEEIVETEFFRDIWGGDEFKFQISLDLYYQDGGEFKRVDANEEEFLGYLNTVRSETGDIHKKDILMKVKNPHLYTFNNVNISVVPYKDTTDISKFVAIAADEASLDLGASDVELGEVLPTSEKTFWIRVYRVDEHVTDISEIYFGLNVFSNIGQVV